MRAWQVVVVVVAAVIAVTEAQRSGRPGGRPGGRPNRPRARLPSRAEMTIAINNPDTMKKALACIEGLPCRLDDEYALMLRRWGPEVMLRGQCPAGLCTPEEAREAKWLMAKIHEKYPRRYMGTVNRLAIRTNPYHGQ